MSMVSVPNTCSVRGLTYGALKGRAGPGDGLHYRVTLLTPLWRRSSIVPPDPLAVMKLSFRPAPRCEPETKEAP